MFFRTLFGVFIIPTISYLSYRIWRDKKHDEWFMLVVDSKNEFPSIEPPFDLPEHEYIDAEWDWAHKNNRRNIIDSRLEKDKEWWKENINKEN